MPFIMDSANDIPMPDMNVPSNLEFYCQIRELENDLSRNEITFNNPDHSQQRALQTIAHRCKLEYGYYLGIARVFRNTNPPITSPSAFNPENNFRGISTSEAAELAMSPFSPPSLPPLANGRPLPRTIHEDGFSYCMSEEQSALLAWDSSAMPVDLTGELLYPDFSGVQQQNESSSSQFQQQTYLTSNMNMDLASIANDAISILDLRYLDPENNHQVLEQSYTPRRSSNSSFAMSTTGALAERPSYEDFSATLTEAPSFNTDYPPLSSGSRGAYQSRQPTSRSGSVSSLQSDRGRSRISKIFKRSSSGSKYSPGSGENVFFSDRAGSSCRASSGRAGRTGPLDYLARLGMKAVKAVGGACWRCKILGKKCSDENPCDSCPKRNAKANVSVPTSWKLIGCKRGSLREEMEPVNLCPRPQVEYPAPETESKTYALDDLSTAHQCKHQPYQTDRDGTECRLCRRKAPESRDALEIDAEQLFFDGTLMRREKDITNENSLGGDQATLLGPLLLTLRSHSLVQDLGLSHRPTSAYHTLTSLIPLDKCILDIIWEVLDQSSNLSKLSLFDRGWEGSLENFVVLLRSAALYQAGLESDPHRLIAQSLICLRQSMDAMRARRVGFFDGHRHSKCDLELQICQVPQVASLNSSLAQYIDELSAVFFKKENLRGKTWWISVFYSLVIQSVIRKLLIGITDGTTAVPSNIQRYLHLAVRLFIASSGGYDPLVREWPSSNLQSPEGDISEIRNYEAAKLAVRQRDWHSLGFHSSGDYLQQLFEDNGLHMEDRAVDGFDPMAIDPPSTRPKIWSTGSDAPLPNRRPSPFVYHPGQVTPNLPSFPVPMDQQPFGQPSTTIPNIPQQYNTGPPTPNSNDQVFFSNTSRSQSMENLAMHQLYSAPSSAHPSRAPSPNGLRNSIQAYQQQQAQIAQAVANGLYGMPLAVNSHRPPTIHKLIPNEGSKAGGIEVTCLGSGFCQGLEVMFGDSKATTTTFWGETSLVCLLPPSAFAGTVPVTFKHQHQQQQIQPYPTPPIPKRQAFFKYVDDDEQQIIRTALSVLGHKMTGKMEDVRDLARRIVGDGPSSLGSSNSPTGGAGRNSNVTGFNAATFGVDVEETLLRCLDLIDLDDSLNMPRLNLRRASGQTMLHLACSLGLHRFVAALLAQGANPEPRDKGGFTPMHFAALHNHPQIVRRLILSGADPTVRSLQGYTPSDMATSDEVLRVGPLVASGPLARDNPQESIRCFQIGSITQELQLCK